MITQAADKGTLIAIGRKLEAEGLVPFKRSKYKDIAAYTARILFLARRLDEEYRPLCMHDIVFMQNVYLTTNALINKIRDERTPVHNRIALMFILKDKLKMAERALDEN